MGFAELLVIIALLVIEFLAVFALIDAIRRPGWQWAQANRGRGMWLTLLVVGLFLPGGGLFIALTYFFFPQPALKRARPPILRPGG
jgi:hypothetical protein